MFTVINICYIVIAAYILFIVIWNLFTHESWKDQVAAVLVVIPLLLRVLQLK